jgi:5-(carboxyamino)imidazole ribonucleotide mutase
MLWDFPVGDVFFLEVFMKVGVIFGSSSDLKILKGVTDTLKEFGVDFFCEIISAHRMPEHLKEKISEMEDNGAEIFIAGAGLAAHLPGVIASYTLKPVIGVPISSAMDGLDSLLSIVQMPSGIPVATVGIDKGKNAAILAAEILSIKYSELKTKLKESRQKKVESILKENENLKDKI